MTLSIIDNCEHWQSRRSECQGGNVAQLQSSTWLENSKLLFSNFLNIMSRKDLSKNSHSIPGDIE